MKRIISLIIVLAISIPPVFADKYLGKLGGSKYDRESTSNEYGKYGSKYSPDSINNPYGKYGSEYSNISPNNPYATNAPKVIERDGQVYLYGKD